MESIRPNFGKQVPVVQLVVFVDRQVTEAESILHNDP
jgi:hypothetical protein